MPIGKLQSPAKRIKYLEEELDYARSEIARLETVIKLNCMLQAQKNLGVINGNIKQKLRDITVGQYDSPTISCSAIRRSKDTNR